MCKKMALSLVLYLSAKEPSCGSRKVPRGSTRCRRRGSMSSRGCVGARDPEHDGEATEESLEREGLFLISRFPSANRVVKRRPAFQGARRRLALYSSAPLHLTRHQRARRRMRNQEPCPFLTIPTRRHSVENILRAYFVSANDGGRRTRSPALPHAENFLSVQDAQHYFVVGELHCSGRLIQTPKHPEIRRLELDAAAQRHPRHHCKYLGQRRAQPVGRDAGRTDPEVRRQQLVHAAQWRHLIAARHLGQRRKQCLYRR